MPVLWIPPAPLLAPTAPPAALASQATEDVVIIATHQHVDLEHRLIRYADGVKVVYGPTVIRADFLEVHLAPGEEYGVATGNVVLDDPEGRLTAARLLFRWKLRSGEADNVYVVSGGFRLRAEHIDIRPESHRTVTDKEGKSVDEIVPPRWTLTNVVGTGCVMPRPIYEIRSPQVIIEPGHGGVAKNPVVYVLGTRLLQLPTQRFSLDKRAKGIGYPTPSLDRANRVGLSWEGSTLLGNSTSFRFSTRVFEKRYPSGRISFTKSLLPEEGVPRSLAPSSEFTEPFQFGYFDSVRVEKYGDEETYLTTPKFLLGASSYLHITPASRLRTKFFDVPLELTAERTLSSHGWGLLTQLRGANLNEIRRETHNRASGVVSLLPPRWEIGRRLYGVARLDGSSFYGSTGLYSWGRLQGGLLAEPSKNLAFGAVYFSSEEAGHPEFEMDPLPFKEGVHARADLRLGQTRLGFVVKYDSRGGRIYDHEYVISRAIGCILVTFTYRAFPKENALVFTLSTSDVFDRISRRTLERTKPFMTPASGPPSDKP